MKVTFQGNPITLKGTQVKVGDTAPDFTVVDNDLNPLKLSDTKGKRVFLTVPSILQFVILKLEDLIKKQLNSVRM